MDFGKNENETGKMVVFPQDLIKKESSHEKSESHIILWRRSWPVITPITRRPGLHPLALTC